MNELVYRFANPSDFESIHRLNHDTFAQEIPQHAPNPQRRLVDRYHEENAYALCVADSGLVGMVCGRCARPFSLDHKMGNLDGCLPSHRKAVEIRLLAISQRHRHTAVFHGLMALLSRHFLALGCDLAVISGSVRQLKLYRHLGFLPFAECVGTSEAFYQPMFLTLDSFRNSSTSGRNFMAQT